MNKPNYWFYLHIVLVLIVLVKDYNGTLEASFDRFEKKVGLYTEPDTTEYEEPPYYIPPIQDDIPIDTTSTYARKI
jgi:hypothetical protein